MGLIGKIFGGVFGGGRNVVADTIGVFRENSEAGAQRQAAYAQAALGQFAAEFQVPRKGWFDSFMDGLNRLPRPMFVLSIFWLFGLVVVDPVYFAEIMTALQLVPMPVWYGVGLIMGFYFGGRMQAKMLDAKREFAQVAGQLPGTLEQIRTIRELRPDDPDSPNTPGKADTGTDAQLSLSSTRPDGNPAVKAWREEAAVPEAEYDLNKPKGIK